MDDALSLGTSYKAAVKRRLPLGAITALVLLTITTALALGLPPRYQSRAIILIEQQEIPQDLVRSLVTSYADQRIQVISQRVLTNSNLSAIIDKYNLYADKRQSEPLEAVLEQMREDIVVTPISAEVADPKAGRSVQATIAFELAYENRIPVLAQRVANELVTLFLNENLKQRTETSRETLTFLTAESQKLRSQVAELEAKLADFKEGNVGKLPELASLNLDLMNRTESEMRALDTQIRSLDQQRVYLESELAQQQPTMSLFSETGERILGSADRLKVLESEFIPLSARYGTNHPDVVAKRKEIESLRAEVGGTNAAGELAFRLNQTKADLAQARKKYSADHPDIRQLAREVSTLEAELQAANASSRHVEPANVQPDNPAYIQLQARLEATATDLSALHAQRTGLAAKLADLENRLTSMPQIEREYRMLTRDYENAQAKYQEVLAKRQEAELASSLESEQQGERFTLIEPPVTPEEPSEPNRLAIVLLGGLLSIAGGFGSGAIAEAFDARIYGRDGVTRAFGVPPLAVIPRINTEATLRNRLARRTAIVAGLFIVLLVIALAIHFIYRPLDVLFFQTLRAVGM